MFTTRLAAALLGWSFSTKICTSLHFKQMFLITKEGTSSRLRSPSLPLKLFVQLPFVAVPAEDQLFAVFLHQLLHILSTHIQAQCFPQRTLGTFFGPKSDYLTVKLNNNNKKKHTHTIWNEKFRTNAKGDTHLARAKGRRSLVHTWCFVWDLGLRKFFFCFFCTFLFAKH